MNTSTVSSIEHYSMFDLMTELKCQDVILEVTKTTYMYAHEEEFRVFSTKTK